MSKDQNPTKIPPAVAAHYKQVTTLIEGVKSDNLAQFGEIKKEFGSVGGRLDDHNKRIVGLEEDKIKRDAIEQYKKEHPEAAAATEKAGREAYNESTGTITVNKELLNALKWLGLVIASLAAAIIAMKATP